MGQNKNKNKNKNKDKNKGKDKLIQDLVETVDVKKFSPIKLKAQYNVTPMKKGVFSVSSSAGKENLQKFHVKPLQQEQTFQPIAIQTPRIIAAPNISKKPNVIYSSKSRIVYNEPSFSNELLEQYMLEEKEALTARRSASQERVPFYSLVIFTRQLAAMLGAGLPLARIFNLLSVKCDDPKLKIILREVFKEILKGETLSKSMAKFPRVFSSTYIATVEAAETSGRVPEIMNQLASHLEREMILISKVKSALMYPLFIISFAVITFFMLMSYVLPVYFEFYKSLNIQLPLITKAVIFVFELPKNPVFIVFFLLFIFSGWKTSQLISSTAELRLKRDKWLFKIPVLGKIYKKMLISVFCRGFGMMSAAGVNYLASLDILKKSSGNMYFGLVLYSFLDDIRSGMTMSQSLKGTMVFPSLVVNLVNVGEETGDVDRMMLKSADFFEQEINYLLGSITTILEPILILFLGIIVGVIVVSLFLPLYNIIGALR